MSKLKRYLDQLANGPLLDSVVPIGRYLKADGVPAREPSDNPVDTERLSNRRVAVYEACMNAAPLKVRKTRGKKERCPVSIP